MRILPSSKEKNRRAERGSAVAVILAMLGIMLIFVGADLVAVRSLDRELKLLEKKQVQRLRRDTPGLAASAKDSTSPASPNEQRHD